MLSWMLRVGLPREPFGFRRAGRESAIRKKGKSRVTLVLYARLSRSAKVIAH